MKKVFVFTAGFLLSFSGLAQMAVKLEEIGKHAGDSVKVCGLVYGGIFLDRSKDSLTFLNVGGSYPNNPLTLVIKPDTRKNFTDKPEQFYKDKTVCILGTVTLFKDKPQIVIYSSGQLMIQ